MNDQDFIRWVDTQPRDRSARTHDPLTCPVAMYVASTGRSIRKWGWHANDIFTATTTDGETYTPSLQVRTALTYSDTYGQLQDRLTPPASRWWRKLVRWWLKL